jgi:hypothetical protein
LVEDQNRSELWRFRSCFAHYLDLYLIVFLPLAGRVRCKSFENQHRQGTPAVLISLFENPCHTCRAGKQQKLNIGTLFRQNRGSSSVSSPSSYSAASEVSPENSATIKYVPVPEILDEAFPEALYGNLSEDNLKIAVTEHQRLLKLSQLQFQNRTKTSSMVKRRNFSSESQKPSIIKLFQTLQGCCHHLV